MLGQAASWSKPRRIVAKVEHYPGALFPQPGFVVTNMTLAQSFNGAFLQQAPHCRTVEYGGQSKQRTGRAYRAIAFGPTRCAYG